MRFGSTPIGGAGAAKARAGTERARAAWRAIHLRATIEALRGSGGRRAAPLAAVAAGLERAGVPALGGGRRWTAVAVARVLGGGPHIRPPDK